MRRNKLQKTVFSVICIVLAVIMMLSLVITVLPAHAVDETDLERLAEKRAQLEEQLAEQEQVIQDLSDNQTLIVYRKAALDKQISLNRETIALIEEQIAVYQELIDRKEEELAAATAAETEQTSLLSERIRSMEAASVTSRSSMSVARTTRQKGWFVFSIASKISCMDSSAMVTRPPFHNR